MAKILITEDDKNMARLLITELEHEGFKTVLAENGREVIKKFHEEKPDLILLDIMLPELNGIEVLRKIRKESDVPVILETARDETFDKINGLNTGADDYISKPFDIEELIARIHSVLRRCEKTKNSSHILKAGNIEINPEKMQVSVSGSSLNFSKTEFFLLKFLIENKGKVLDRNTIIDSVWRKEHFIDAGAVDVYIRFLRTKIKEFDDTEYIKTVRGSGYIFEE